MRLLTTLQHAVSMRTYSIVQSIIMVMVFVPAITLAANDQFIVNQFVGVDDPPTIPGNVVATPLSQTAITVTWNPSVDDTGLAGYEVFRNSMFLATVTAPTTAYTDTSLTSSTSYSYAVRAYDIGLLYSALSTSSATTTYAAIVATATPAVSSQGGGTQIKPLAQSISAYAQTDSIVLTILSSLKVKLGIRWGTTADTSQGTLTLPTFEETHRTALTGLKPGTTYTIVVTTEDEYGRTLIKTIKVTTTVGTDAEAPSNPSLFTGVPTKVGTVLTWKNPSESDFSNVRIMRQAGTVPVDPYDGVVVYEGELDAFTDTDVKAGVVYGYTIFARDESGNYSSGAVTFVRTWSEETFGDVQFPTDDGAEATTTLTSEMVVTQGDIAQYIEGSNFTISNDAPFLLQVPAHAFPRVLKTILVTLRHPDGSGKSFTFLLRANKERTAYEARIDTLGELGEYQATISFLNLSSQMVLKNNFTLTVTEGMEALTITKDSPKMLMVAFMGILTFMGILIGIVIFATRKMWHLGKQAAQPKNNTLNE
jgi:hypothetical protein